MEIVLGSLRKQTPLSIPAWFIPWESSPNSIEIHIVTLIYNCCGWNCHTHGTINQTHYMYTNLCSTVPLIWMFSWVKSQMSFTRQKSFSDRSRQKIFGASLWSLLLGCRKGPQILPFSLTGTRKNPLKQERTHDFALGLYFSLSTSESSTECKSGFTSVYLNHVYSRMKHIVLSYKYQEPSTKWLVLFFLHTDNQVAIADQDGVLTCFGMKKNTSQVSQTIQSQINKQF